MPSAFMQYDEFSRAIGLLALHIRQACGPTYRLDGGPHTIRATAPAHP